MKIYTIKYWTNGAIVQFLPPVKSKNPWLHICFKKEIITTRDIPFEDLRYISRLLVPQEYHTTLEKVIFQHALFSKDCHEISWDVGTHDVEQYYNDDLRDSEEKE